MKIFRAFFSLMVLYCLAQAQAPAQPASENKGVISGRVLAEGQPVANAVVTASTGGTRQARAATTDEDGAFQITGLAPAAYLLRATLPGYVVLPQLDPMGEPQRVRVGAAVTINMLKGGAITGKVFTASGDPIPGLSIVALRLRDEAGKLTSYETYARRTDDRGVYRIFGLPPGNYLVYTNGKDFGWSHNADELANDGPTYHPSSTRDTAAELKLGQGEELSGIDIRYRGERGYRISGKLVGALNGFGANIFLQKADSGEVVATDWRSSGPKRPEDPIPFEIRGAADGEYEVVAEVKNGNEDGAVSQSHRVTVSRADVTGIELRMRPLAVVPGNVVLEEAKAAPICEHYKPSTFEEVAVSLLSDVASAQPLMARPSATLSRAGEFKIRFVDPGRYRFSLQLPNQHWYVRAITTLPDPRTKKATDLALTGLTVRANEKPAIITLATGAAALQGKLQPSKVAPANLKIHLLPAEKEASENVLRYAETQPANDGTFAFAHLSPGKYWLVVRPSAETVDARPAAWDGIERAKLRRAAEAANLLIELQPCQHVVDYLLK
jgi:hypothetical protein